MTDTGITSAGGQTQHAWVRVLEINLTTAAIQPTMACCTTTTANKGRWVTDILLSQLYRATVPCPVTAYQCNSRTQHRHLSHCLRLRVVHCRVARVGRVALVLARLHHSINDIAGQPAAQPPAAATLLPPCRCQLRHHCCHQLGAGGWPEATGPGCQRARVPQPGVAATLVDNVVHAPAFGVGGSSG